MTTGPRSRVRNLVWLAVILAPPIGLLVDLGLAFAEGYWTRTRTWQVVIACSVVWLLGVGMLLSVPRVRARLPELLPRLGTLVVSAVASWFLAELVLGVASAPRLTFHLRAPGSSATFRPNPEALRGIEGESRYTVNSFGVRGPEFGEREAEHRILCVGGSTTECLYIDDSETWTRLFGDKLQGAVTSGSRGYWTGDAGRSGFATWDHVFLLENTELLEQIDCIVFLVGLNDFLHALNDETEAVRRGVRPVFEYSNIVTLVRAFNDARRQRRQFLHEDSKGNNYARRRQARANAARRTSLPGLEQGLADFQANLAELMRGCDENNVVPVFMTSPVLWKRDLPPADEALLWLGWSHGTVPTDAALASGVEAFNDALREFCAEHNLGLIDLAPLNGQSDLFYDDCHFNELGARAVADRVAAWFRAHPLD